MSTFYRAILIAGDVVVREACGPDLDTSVDFVMQPNLLRELLDQQDGFVELRLRLSATDVGRRS